MPGPGFAVIDFETTGFLANKYDRVIEVGVVHVSPTGAITGEWETLVNPNRDLGPQHVHGIRGADVMPAPEFADVAAHLVELLRGRVIVAHNARFDLAFLFAELTRAGCELAVAQLPHLDTMRLATDFLPGAGRTLADCCAAFDIDLTDAHRALTDAHATAELLGSYIGLAPEYSLWETQLAAALDYLWPVSAVVNPLELVWMARGSNSIARGPFLSRIARRLPDIPGTFEQREYLALLDSVLLDRRISAHEADQLVELAAALEIGHDSAIRLHVEYFDSLVKTAWADGILTVDEIADLAAVAKLLEIPAERIATALQTPTDSSVATTASSGSISTLPLATGDRIVLTGEMSRPREVIENELRARGYEPWAAVTKKVKLVVAADPDSLSGKARKARDYGIPIVGEDWLVAHLQ